MFLGQTLELRLELCRVRYIFMEFGEIFVDNVVRT